MEEIAGKIRVYLFILVHQHTTYPKTSLSSNISNK
jgi:hypothetical protein